MSLDLFRTLAVILFQICFCFDPKLISQTSRNECHAWPVRLSKLAILGFLNVTGVAAVSGFMSSVSLSRVIHMS